jgi:hypothetical protein
MSGGTVPTPCPVCGDPFAACGGAGAPVNALEFPTEARRPPVADLALYEVPHRDHTMTVKLSAEDAEALYGDQAKKIGEVKKAEPQPVSKPPYAAPVPEPGESLVTSEKKSPPPRNKTRS